MVARVLESVGELSKILDHRLLLREAAIEIFLKIIVRFMLDKLYYLI